MRTQYDISPGALLTAALLLLLLPLKWLAAAFFAAFFHELAHYAALRLCGMRPRRFFVGGNGAAMEIGGLAPGRELICALAGPIGSFLLIFFAQWFPRLALCGVFHGLYNLLPLYPLDGGRALYCATGLLFPPNTARSARRILESICMWAICISALYGTLVLHLGLLPVGFALLLLLKWKKAKIPCKEDPLAVQ